ncbi:hypothetical protein [Kitasatospora mediocidica]|uniref:hypothetical protein n=1 Tax=Kitasatospora mediocidica TaxID=58352 RepID=UPI00055CE31D|nr:hypothetical protein [Kitasatospora mediocidica]
MAGDIVRTGDSIVITPPPGVSISPNRIPLAKGSGGFQVGGVPACIPPDVSGMPPVPCTYSKPGFAGGVGMLTFTLLPGNLSQVLTTGQPVVVDSGTPLLFTFMLTKPAQTPNGIPDALPPLGGDAKFDRKPLPRAVQA